MTRLFLAAGVALLLGAALRPANPPVEARRALAADTAADMVGVNTHLYYYDRIYGSGWERIVRPRLLELGARHIRDGLNPADAAYHAKLTDLARSGVRALLVHWDPKNAGVERSRDTVRALNADASHPVEAVEPPNEHDNAGEGWEARLSATMSAMWRAYREDSATRGMAIVGPSFANTRDSAARMAVTPDAGRWMDFGNVHSYSGGNPVEGPLGGGWGISLDDALARYRRLSRAKPLMATEAGFHNAVSGGVPGHFGVTERAASKYMPRLFLTYLRKGVRRVYLYELMDEGSDPRDMEQNFGLVRLDGTPKEQFRAVRAFIRLLADPGPAFRPGSLHMRLDGADGVEVTLLQKRDGRFYLALWQPVASYDPRRRADVEPPERTVTLTLDRPAGGFRVFRPSTHGVAPVAAPGAGPTLRVTVPDHVVLVEIRPAGGGGRPAER